MFHEKVSLLSDIRRGLAYQVRGPSWSPSYQLPMAANEDIEIKLIDPKIKENNPNLIMTDEKFIEWGLDIKAGEKRVVPFSYSIEYPKDMVVSGL